MPAMASTGRSLGDSAAGDRAVGPTDGLLGADAAPARHRPPNAVARQNAACWAALQARPDADAPQQALLLALPSGPAEAREASKRRRQRYRAHVRRIVAEAVADPAVYPSRATAASQAAPSASGPASPQAGTIADALCGVCRGGCCTLGGDSAFLSADTVRRVMAAQPQWSPDELTAAYLDHVPQQGQLGSCINHSASGCSLPRAMRSDTCNNFVCDALAQLQQRQRSADPARSVIVVQRRQNHWNSQRPDLDNAITACWALSDAGVVPLTLPPALPV